MTMKTTHKIISNKIVQLVIFWATVASMTSCDDFLVENPKDRVAQSNFYISAQDAEFAINAIYGYLGSYSAGNTAGIYHSTFWYTIGLASDEMNNNQLGTFWNDELANFGYNAENTNMLEIWEVHYKSIFLANIAIERIPLIEMDSNQKNRLVNEAKFLRGLLYFNLVRMYGDIPLLTTEESPLYPASDPASEVYAQIIADLTAAEDLPEVGDILRGRATRGAAKALLSKVYLTLEDYEKASEKALEVINSGKYGLWDSFEDVFKLSSRGGKEAVFSVGFGDAGGAISFWEVGQFNVRLLPLELTRSRAKVNNTHGWQVATDHLYNDFSNEDSRKSVTFMANFLDDNGNQVNLSKIHIRKYWDEPADPTAGGSFNDFQVIRYAEVLLIYAEAQAALGQFATANEYLNKVRTRANLPNVEINTQEAFISAIISERRKEFVAEGHRWFDLVRLGKLEEKVNLAKGISVNPIYNLFPIPQRERNVNPNLSQNPGY
ncbi:RagB/SusD family nutrient uptake outer membrane protein [Pararhodonellum marinum]|uniref:RagB/SusD family nutrient uptake outer membrane protein n=1 Tax=Pararhodonellum marinum TaxID=2755358 RepID=UPI001E5A73B3|nr:RagB/SusD family nutrient uptake outer membrane protein [Pararhodonellum marinum]